MSHSSKQIIVIGGGITGLTAAYRLTKEISNLGLDYHVKLLEGSSQPGGVISTRQENGFTFEEGPDCFISNKPSAVNLCKELNIDSEIIGTSPHHRRSFILRGNKLLPVPQGFYLLAPTSIRALITTPIFSWFGKLRMAMEYLIPPKRSEGDESLENFVLRRLGREALERMAQPMVAGIYTADPHKLSVEATFPQFLEWEQKYGSIIKALIKRRREDRDTSESSGPRYSLFLSFTHGLQTLIDAIVEAFPPETIQLNSIVKKISHDDTNGRWSIFVDNGTELEADALCLALPAKKTSKLLKPVNSNLADQLEDIPYLGSITVNLAFRRNAIKHPLDGMGFVVPAVEGRTILACSFSSVKFENRSPDDHVLLRAFVGGPWQQDYLEKSDSEILDVVLEDLRPILGINDNPIETFVHKHPEAMPQYHLGHKARVRSIEELVNKVEGLTLAGNGYHGVGIPDCINSAEKASQRILRFLQSN